MQTFVEMERPYESLYQRKFDEEEQEKTPAFASKEQDFNERWGWFVSLDMLSNNNPILWDQITEWNVIKFLNTVSYYHEKAKAYERV